MRERSDNQREPLDDLYQVGLCRSCIHARVIRTPRGSTFYLCRLSETDPRFAKYPRLPVVQCKGYAKA